MDKFKRSEEEYFAREEIEKRHKLHRDIANRERGEHAAKDRATALLNLRRNSEGMKLLLAALDNDPRAADAMLVLADAYQMIHRPQQALHWYRRYLEILPNGEGAESARQNLRTLTGGGQHEVIRSIVGAFRSSTPPVGTKRS